MGGALRRSGRVARFDQARRQRAGRRTLQERKARRRMKLHRKMDGRRRRETARAKVKPEAVAGAGTQCPPQFVGNTTSRGTKSREGPRRNPKAAGTIFPPGGPARLPLRSPGCPTCAPSRGFGAPGVLYADELRGIGSPLPPRPRVFTLALAVSLVRRPLSSFDEVSSSCELSASAESCGLRAAFAPGRTLRPDRTAEERLPWGPRPSSRRQQAASTFRRNPDPAVTFRPRRSHVSTVPPPPAFAGLFRPLPRPGFALQGLSSPRSRTGFPRARHALLP